MAGQLSLGLSTAHCGRFRAYVASWDALLLFMAAAIAVDWSGLADRSRTLYLGLFALGLYMLWRAVRAGSGCADTTTTGDRDTSTTSASP